MLEWLQSTLGLIHLYVVKHRQDERADRVTTSISENPLYLFKHAGLAPLSNNTFATALQPFKHAQCKGVLPSAFLVSTSCENGLQAYACEASWSRTHHVWLTHRSSFNQCRSNISMVVGCCHVKSCKVAAVNVSLPQLYRGRCFELLLTCSA